ncbi:MAG TPA: RDD family protein [Candidatus Angelobacter sp.]|nr:RDD family protein [Candidatus Angelobacter sp.]
MFKVRNFRWPFAGLLAFILLISVLNRPTILGFSLEWSSGDYSFAGGTTTWALCLSLLIIMVYLALMYAAASENQVPLPGVFRRFVAFWLDFIIAMMAVTPIAGLLPTVTEWRRTGTFQWAFERSEPAPGDWALSCAALIVGVVALIFYFSWPLVRRRPSPGACVAGYQIVPDEGATLTLGRAILRTLLGFVAACACFLAPFVGRDRKKGKFWLDKVFDTRAVGL